MDAREFSFGRSCDLHLPCFYRIARLEGKIPPRSYKEILEHPELRHTGSQLPTLSDLYVTTQLFSDNKPLSLVHRTKHKAFTKSYTWNEWLTIPNRFSSIPVNSQLAITVWDIQGAVKAVPVGGATMRLFEKSGYMKRGEQRLYLHRGLEADGAHETTTPSDIGLKDEMGRLEGLVQKFEKRDMPHLDWLDRMTFKEIEKIHAIESAKSPHLFLYIDLPKFDFPIVFAEPEKPSTSAQRRPTASTNSAVASPSSARPASSIDAHLWSVLDPDMFRENLVEAKHRRLVRSHRTGALDRELKPTSIIRDELNVILKYPPTQVLEPEEKDLIWKYRFYLSRDKKALTKFLKSVSWTDVAEVKQAVEVLLPMWTDIEMDDALELLGPSFIDGRVRAYAVKQLDRADDEELLLYLLQLVQALKFEIPPADNRSIRSSRSGTGASGGAAALSTENSGLADFLIGRSVLNPVLGNSLYWYLMVECEDRTVGKMYAKISFRFMTRLMETEGGAERRDILRRQGELVATLSTRARDLRASKDRREKKIEKLRAYIADPKHSLSTMAPLPLPINGRILTTGIAAEKSTIFKSNLLPLLLWFQCPPAEDASPDEPAPEYPLIFKNGDDLRQDQLVVQLFTLMDRLLRKENLDLKLRMYSVMATGTEEGMIQYVPSKTLAGIVSEHGSLLNYLRAGYPDEGSVASYGVEPSVLDTFVRSCAGYCVLTYLLGVGDRHLDNLMLAPDGHFFHVDFGYILGRDPKPFPPPLKLSREMIEAMGGPSSPHYLRFKRLCYTAFSNLRKNANLILNLVALMVQSGVQDIRLEPDKAVAKIQDNFMLHLTEDEAIKQFEVLLNQTSVLTAVFDVIHDWAQYWRS